MADRDELDRDDEVTTDEVRDVGDDMDDEDEGEAEDLDEEEDFASGHTDEVGSEGGSPGGTIERPDDRGPTSGSEATETVRRRDR